LANFLTAFENVNVLPAKVPFESLASLFLKLTSSPKRSYLPSLSPAAEILSVIRIILEGPMVL